ncbi:PEGA domain-containing protein [Sorangium sp. So ce131]|uniref:PEGA domain-containing protein n=1 Tax=Sorangium sp. So ce131 TaxID=3133282 RepID=UPI003F602BF9
MRASGSRRGGRGLWTLLLATGLGITAVDATAQPRPAPSSATAPPAPALQAERPPLSLSLQGEAKAEYTVASVLVQQRDYENASVRFQRAYELSRDHRLLWDVALCHKELRRYARLLGTLDQMEAEAGAALSDQERQDIVALRAFAERLVSRMEILTSAPGAEVFVDGERVGTTPFPEPVPVDIGERKIRIVKPGFKEITRTETVAGGGRIAFSVTLDKVAPRGRLRVAAGPSDVIAIDGQVVGRGAWEGSLTAGAHVLRVTAPGMLAHQAEVLVQDGETRRIDVTLDDTVDRGMPWLWIGGGAALLAGALVAGAVVFEPGRPAKLGTLGSFPLSFGTPGGRR